MLVRVADLAEHIRACLGQNGAPTDHDSPEWIAHYLAARSVEIQSGISYKAFSRLLGDERTLLLLDGLDEAPGRSDREHIAGLALNCRSLYPRCQIVITTRPRAYLGKATLAQLSAIRDILCRATKLPGC